MGTLLHPLLLDQLERVIAAAEAERSRRVPGQPAAANTRVAASLWQLILAEVPQDPSRSTYRQGSTLGADMRHWMRSTFGNGRFRLFFRYHSEARLIGLAWVNDSESLRTYGSRTDAYAVFRRMVDSGNPPDDWDDLVRASSSPDAIRRARALVDRSDAGGADPGSWALSSRRRVLQSVCKPYSPQFPFSFCVSAPPGEALFVGNRVNSRGPPVVQTCTILVHDAGTGDARDQPVIVKDRCVSAARILRSHHRFFSKLLHVSSSGIRNTQVIAA